MESTADMPANVAQGAIKHVSVCICTLRRPKQLETLLRYLAQQETNGDFTFSIIITDNDTHRSAESVVAEFNRIRIIPVKYSLEPRQNIALARNEALRHATGEFVALIDDDELPDRSWLATMLEVCEKYGAAGVLGPVRPCFQETPPRWVLKGHFWERPEHPTGWIMVGDKCRTGNVLFRREILNELDQVFNPLFGTGGEDKDFFLRMIGKGHVFRWCNEAPVYETVPRERCTRAYLLKRAMLRGQNNIRQPLGRAQLVAKSMLATPILIAVLPFTLMFGQHVFVGYCIRLCDHAGRLLALFGCNPITER